MSDKKTKYGLWFLVFLALVGQGATTYTVYKFNETAGVMLAALFAYIDIGLFIMLAMASNDVASDRDRKVLYSCSALVGVFAVLNIIFAISTADIQGRNDAKKELAEVTRGLAVTAGDQAALSSTVSKDRAAASKSNRNLQTRYSNQALNHSNVVSKSLDQAALFVNESKSLIETPTRRETVFNNMDGWKKNIYLVYAAILVVLIPSVMWHYGCVFSRRIDLINKGKTVKPNKTKAPHNPRPTGGGGGSKTKTETKTTTLKNAPKLELVKTDSKLELSRKWALNTSDKINVKNLMDHLKRNKEGVSNEKARGYLIEMCKGSDKILQRTSTAKNAGFIRIKKLSTATI